MGAKVGNMKRTVDGDRSLTRIPRLTRIASQMLDGEKSEAAIHNRLLTPKVQQKKRDMPPRRRRSHDPNAKKRERRRKAMVSSGVMFPARILRVPTTAVAVMLVPQWPQLRLR